MPVKIVTPTDSELLNVLGNHLLLRLAGADTGGAYSLVEQIDQPGPGVPLHIHEREDEAFHVVEGGVELQLGDRALVGGPGTTAFLPRGIAHGYRVVGPGLTRVLIAAYPAGIEWMFRELDQLTRQGAPMPQVAATCGRFGIRFV